MTEITVLGTNEKRIICGPTINQLVPFRYPWAWEWYLDSNKNHWTPSDVNMAPDISDYKFKLSADDRHLFITMLATLTTADIVALRNVSFAIMEKITAPEVQIAYTRHAYEESIHCYIDDTEILTTTGFKDFRDLLPTDRVAQYHPDGQITFTVPLEILHDAYSGTMYEFANDSRTYVSVVTPDHRCVVTNPRQNDKLEIILAKDLHPQNYNIPVAGHLTNPKPNVFSTMDSIRVAFQAVGSMTNSHVVDTGQRTGKYVIRFHLSRPRKIERIIALAKAANVEYSSRQYHDNKDGSLKYLISLWLPVGEAIDKSFDWVDLTKIDSVWIDCFFDELKHWDSSIRSETSICYVNTNSKAVQKVMLLTTLSDRRSGTYAVSTINKNRPAWQLHCYSKSHASGRTIKRNELTYEGTVHCVGVPTGMVITRYQGCVTVSGNTWTYQHCIEGLSLDPTEIYTLYQRIPEITAKFTLANRYLKGVTDIGELVTQTQIEDFLYSLLFFCLIFEGVWFYNGFSPLLNFQRRGEMKGTCEQLQYILRDETNHVRLGVNVARAIIQENNIVLDTARLHRMFKEAYDVNEVFIKYAMRAGGTAGLSLDQYLQHERYMSNRRLAMVGIEPVFTNASPTLKWLDEQAGTNKEKNFFNIGDFVA